MGAKDLMMGFGNGFAFSRCDVGCSDTVNRYPSMSNLGRSDAT
jgi:hypothetical protein